MSRARPRVIPALTAAILALALQIPEAALQADNITNTLINVASLEISGLADNFAGVPEPGRVIFGQLRHQF